MNEKKKGRDLIDLAIEVAVEAHKNQFRKGTDIPYITHPLSVGIILAKTHCSDEVIAAGILHDTVEDSCLTPDYIRDTFGNKIADIVEGVSEPNKSLPWEKRKRHTLDVLKKATLEVKFVVLADKLDNIKAISLDYEKIGEALWGRFNRGKADQKWYYQELVKVLCEDSAHEVYQNLQKQFAQVVSEVFGNEA